MRDVAVLAVLCLASVTHAADPPTATVTGRNNGKAVTFPKVMGTLVQGLAIVTFGTAQFESEADKDQWEAAIKSDHVLIKFPKPQGLAANIQDDNDDGKTYEVSDGHAAGPDRREVYRVRQV
jgi:hypothetical protein